MKPVTLVRYEVVDAEHPEREPKGIFAAMFEAFDDDADETARSLWLQFRLPLPTCNMSNSISYFTPKGNRKFHKAILSMSKDLNKTGRYHVVRTTRQWIIDNGERYYDNYQVVFSRK